MKKQYILIDSSRNVTTYSSARTTVEDLAELTEDAEKNDWTLLRVGITGAISEWVTGNWVNV